MAALTRSTITSVAGVRVGHAADFEVPTGVTACVFDRAALCAVDIRGGASCTYDTGSLDLEATFGRRWAVFLTGGSVYGLDAARGVRTRLAETGRYSPAFGGRTPVVQISGATLFDLPLRGGKVADYLPLGYDAARAASTGSVGTGRIGAGAGATVGKYLGRDRAMPGGLGSAAAVARGLGRVGVLAVVNAIGGVRDPVTNRWVAGARSRRGRIVPPPDFDDFSQVAYRVAGTTLVVVATDAVVDRRELRRIAVLTGTGIARAIAPLHAAVDGDVVFAVSTASRSRKRREQFPGQNADVLGRLSAGLVVRAILSAVG